MKFYYCKEDDKYYTSSDVPQPDERYTLLFEEHISEGAYQQLKVSAYEFVMLKAMLIQQETSLENCVEEFLNGAPFVCDVWMHHVKDIADLAEGLVDHSIYFNTEEEFNEFIKERAEDYGSSEEEVREEAFDQHRGSEYLVKLPFGYCGGFVSY